MTSTMPFRWIFTFVVCVGVAWAAGEQCTDNNLIQTDTLTTCLTDLTTGARTVTPEIIPSTADLRVYIRASVQQHELSQDDVCCRSIRYAAVNVTLNPLQETTYNSHVFRTTPTFHFFSRSRSVVEEGDNNLYTILMYDISPNTNGDEAVATADRPLVLWLKTNIRGLNVSTGDEVLPYHSPHADTTYVFLLYKQPAQVTVARGQYDVTSDHCRTGVICMFDINSMVDDLALDLVGVTWLQSQYDAAYYSYLLQTVVGQPARDVCLEIYEDITIDGNGEPVCDVQSDVCDNENMQSDDGIKECLSAIQLATNRRVPELVKPSQHLQTYITITAATEELPLGNFCCKDRAMPAASVTIHPLERKRIPPQALRLQPTFTFTSRADGPAVGDDNLYTMIFVDASLDLVSGNALSAPGKPFLHWMQTNIQGLNFSTGVDVQPYIGVSLDNLYTMLLYKQAGQVTIDPGDYDGAEEQCPFSALCRFDVQSVVEDHSLTLIGSSWFSAAPDPEYISVFLLTNMLLPETVVCNLLPDIHVPPGSTRLNCDTMVVEDSADSDCPSGGVKATVDRVVVVVMITMATMFLLF